MMENAMRFLNQEDSIMANINSAHTCNEIGCEICAAREAHAAGERLNNMPKKFTARKRNVSAVDVATNPAQQTLSDNDGPFVAQPAALSTAEATMKFILAGNAYFTIRSQKTGTRYTFRVAKPKENKMREQVWFVSLLTGPQNTSDYTYMGMITAKTFKLTRASKYNQDSIPVVAFSWLWLHLIQSTMPKQTEVWHEGRCGRCGRALTVPESIAAGIGPECAGKMGV